MLETSKLLPNQLISSSHSQTVTDLKLTANKIAVRMVADAFVAALTSAPKRWLSVLPATALGLSMPEHENVNEYYKDGTCKICFFNEKLKKDLIQFTLDAAVSGTGWGEFSPLDALLTLKLANATPIEDWPKPTDVDIWNFFQLIDHIKNLKNNERYSSLTQQIKSNHWLTGPLHHIQEVLVCLSVIGILEHDDYPGLMTAWTTAHRRDNRPNVRVEVPAPLAWWSGDMGINQLNFDKLFGHLKVPAVKPEKFINTHKPQKRKKSTLPKIQVIKDPLAHGDVFSVRYAEDRWGAVYCHEVKESEMGVIYGCIEYLDIIKKTPVEVGDLNQLGFKNRVNKEERTQYWVSGLNKGATIKCIAKEVSEPKSDDEAPKNRSFLRATQLSDMAKWHFKS